MMRIFALLAMAGCLAACSQVDDTAALCTFDEHGHLIMEAGNVSAACEEPAAIPIGAAQERSGRLTILEAPLPPPFYDLGKEWPPQPVTDKPKLVRPSVPPELAYYIRAFPQAERPAGDTLDLGSEHTVVLRDGCFLLDREGDDDPLVHFPYGTALTIDDEGYLAFGSRYEPDRMGTVRVGLSAETGWFSEPSAASPELAAACGDHMVVSVTTVTDPFAWPQRFNPALRRYGERSGDRHAKIIEQANACAVRQARREADRRLRNPSLQPIDCNRFWGF